MCVTCVSAPTVRPLTVKLLGTNNPLSVGVTYQLTCQCVGSRPAATITWWMGGQKLRLTNQVSLNSATQKLRSSAAGAAVSQRSEVGGKGTVVFAVENSLQYFADVFSWVAFGDILLELQLFDDKIFLGDLHRLCAVEC